MAASVVSSRAWPRRIPPVSRPVIEAACPARAARTEAGMCTCSYTADRAAGTRLELGLMEAHRRLQPRICIGDRSLDPEPVVALTDALFEDLECHYRVDRCAGAPRRACAPSLVPWLSDKSDPSNASIQPARPIGR